VLAHVQYHHLSRSPFIVLSDVPMEMTPLSVLLDVMEKLCLLDPNSSPIFISDSVLSFFADVLLRCLEHR